MRLRNVQGIIFEGGLNVNAVVTDEAGRSYLKRYPKEGSRTLQLLRHEHDALGFSERGGRFRRRSLEEQARFLQLAAARGLKVLPPAYTDEKGYAYYRFIIDISAKSLENSNSPS